MSKLILHHICRRAKFLTALVMLMPMQAWAQALEAIDYSSLPGSRVQLELQFSGPVPEPRSFTIDDPARLSLDFPGVIVNMQQRSINTDVEMMEGINVLEAGGRTRVVLNLQEIVPYQTRVEGNKVLVVLNEAPSPGVASRVAEPVGAEGTVPGIAGLASSPHIESIDFHRGEQGEALIQVRLSTPALGADIVQKGEELIATFPGAALPEELDRRLDVVDFATPVNVIDSAPSAQGALVSILMGNTLYDYLVYQFDNDLTIEIKPVSEQQREVARRERAQYTGERLSLNFQDIEVRAILQLLADFTGLNLVASDSVSGNVTLRLKNVPWDQALDIILKSKGLGMRKDNNVLVVAPQQELATQERLELEAEQQLMELEPLQTDYIQINYARADDLANLIRGEVNNLLSDRGSVSVDQRTNTLIVQDSSFSLEAIRDMVGRLDIPVKQVLIESRIVRASEDFGKDLGVRFGYSQNIRTGNTAVSVGGANAGEFTYSGRNAEGQLEPVCTGFCTDGDNEGYIVNLPTITEGSPARLQLAVGRLGSWLLQLQLSALLSEGRGDQIANPKVITVNQGEALIETGVEIPYQETTSSGATSISFRQAVLSLRVTPQITPDNRVLLDMEISQDSVGELDVLGTPTIDTNSMQTQVLVDNGETVVLGGIYTQRDRRDRSSIPFFGTLPYVGFLFEQKSRTSNKAELLIFVTPKILDEIL